jgi:two-component system, cell cycle sensor histidine kinase and response regulator CckA
MSESDEKAATPQVTGDQAMPQTKILVTEDEGIVAMDVESRLQTLGYAVAGVAASGEEAIRLAETTRPDLILMDIKLMGQLDGVSAAEQIRTRFDIPVIYLTAYADDATLQRAKITEPYAYLIKPFEERELLTAIEIALYKHAMEMKLRRSEQWLSTTLRSIGDGVIATDVGGRVQFMNPMAETLTGWTQSEAFGRPLTDVFRIVNDKSGEVMESPVGRVLREGTLVGLASQSVLVSRDGRERPIADSGAPITDAQGQSIGVVLAFRDMTERRRLEEERQKVQRLESVGVLAGGIAHDFNNILTGILGNIDLARGLLPADSRAAEVLSDALKASWRARDLTQQLLTFAKGGTPVKRTLQLGRLVRDAVEFALRGSNVCCEFDLAVDLWQAEVDAGQMIQAITNLVINADQAMPEGGVLHVGARNVTFEPDAEVPVTGRCILIEIADQGVGIPAAHLARIFDPYFTTKQKGSGLGLAITYSVMKRHGGYISVESKPGQGTTFHLYLPASSTEPAVAETAPREKAALTGHGRVLIVDDEEMVRLVTARAMSEVGFETGTADDGALGAEMYQAAMEAGRPFDLVILDLTVPGGVGGTATLLHLRQIDPNVKAIVCSGYSDDPVLADYASYGFAAAVSKPFAIDDLCRTVIRLLGQ